GSGFWWLVCGVSQQLPARLSLRTDHSLDGFPFQPAGDGNRNFCPRSDRALGDAETLRAFPVTDGYPVAPGSAELGWSVDADLDDAGRGDDGTPADRGGTGATEGGG